MKVLMIDNFLPGSTYSLELGRELKKSCDLSIFCRKNADVQEEGIAWIPQGYPVGGKRAVAVLAYGISLLKLAGTIHRGIFAVVHVQSFHHAAYEMEVFYRMRRYYGKLVCTVHNVLPHEARPGDWERYKRFYDQCDGLIVHNETSKACLMQQFSVPEKKITVIAHGSYQNQKFQESKKERYQDKAVKQFLQFGFIRTYKGIDILLDAIALIQPEKRKGLHVTIAGEQFPKLDGTDYMAKIRNLGLEPYVSFCPGHVREEDIPELLANMDFLLFPYRNIYGSGALLLAYTYGKPVIASDIPAFCEETDGGRTGILFAKHNPQALADAILEAVACSEEQMEKYRLAIGELVSEKYNWKKSAVKTAHVYET